MASALLLFVVLLERFLHGSRCASRQVGHRVTLRGIGSRAALVAPVIPVQNHAVRQETAVVVPTPRALVAIAVRAAQGAAAADVITDVLGRIRRPGIAGHLQGAACPRVGMVLRTHPATANRQSCAEQYRKEPMPFHGTLLI